MLLFWALFTVWLIGACLTFSYLIRQPWWPYAWVAAVSLAWFIALPVVGVFWLWNKVVK